MIKTNNTIIFQRFRLLFLYEKVKLFEKFKRLFMFYYYLFCAIFFNSDFFI